MRALPPCTYLITASASDGYDALVRLLVDAQRFGLVLNEVSSVVLPDASVSIRMTVSSESDLDCDAVQSRLSRHPAIAELRTTRLGALPGHARVEAGAQMTRCQKQGEFTR